MDRAKVTVDGRRMYARPERIFAIRVTFYPSTVCPHPDPCRAGSSVVERGHATAEGRVRFPIGASRSACSGNSTAECRSSKPGMRVRVPPIAFTPQ